MKIVNLKHSPYDLYIGRENKTYNLPASKWANPYDLYIGRENKTYNLPASKWANPYPLSNYSLEECLMLYEEHIRNSDLYNQLDELEGLTLGCWCFPNRCHGDILFKLYNEKRLNDLIK